MAGSQKTCQPHETAAAMDGGWISWPPSAVLPFLGEIFGETGLAGNGRVKNTVPGRSLQIARLPERVFSGVFRFCRFCRFCRFFVKFFRGISAHDPFRFEDP